VNRVVVIYDMGLDWDGRKERVIHCMAVSIYMDGYGFLVLQLFEFTGLNVT
jgi:hypothetical protein